jgi:hypothetical protein
VEGRFKIPPVFSDQRGPSTFGLREKQFVPDNNTPCAYDITPENAKLSYQKLQIELKERATKDVTQTSCIEHNICSKLPELALYDNYCGVNHELFHWSLVSDVNNGSSALKTLIERAKNGLPLHLNRQRESETNVDKMIIEGSVRNKKERHYALCEVLVVSNVVGPPRNCVAVALTTPNASWVRVRFPGMGCPFAYSPRISGAIDIDFEIQTKNGTSHFINKIYETLRSTFDLSTKIDLNKDHGYISSARIVATAGVRESKIIPGGWREALDFDLFIRDGSKEGKSIVDVSGVAHALVSRQALGSLIKYRGLSDSERELYGRAFDSAIANAIAKSCKRYRLVDSGTIECD